MFGKCMYVRILTFFLFVFYHHKVTSASSNKNNISESDVTYSQVWWRILRISALHLPIQSAHTHTHTHTQQYTHTPGAVCSHLCGGTRGAVGGSVSCSRAPSSWYWRWTECWTFTPPPTTIPAGPRLELTTFPLWVRLSTIRPRLPRKVFGKY